MLAWASIAALKGALGDAFVAFEKKFYPLAPAQFADGAGITCHLIESPLYIPTRNAAVALASLSRSDQKSLHVGLYAAPFGWPTTIVWDRCNINNRSDGQAGSLQ